MRRRIFWALAALTAALALTAGLGTFAFFSSTTTNPANRFVAGTLVLGNDRDATFILQADNMQPGDSVLRTVTLSRAATSTLDMNYTVQQTGLTGSLCPSLAIVVVRTDAGQDVNDGAAIPLSATVSTPADTVSTFAGSPVTLGSLNNSGNSADTYSFQVTFVETNTDQSALMGASCEVTYTWTGRQQTTNDDLVTRP